LSTKQTTVNSTITVKLFEHGGPAALVSVNGQMPERAALILALKAISRYLLRKRTRILT